MGKLNIAGALQYVGLRLLATAEKRGPASDFWFSPPGGNSLAGAYISADTAMRIGTVFAAVRILAESVAALPLIVYRRNKSGGKDRATDHPLYALLHDQPNPRETSFEFRERKMAHVLLRGAAYSRIVLGRNGVAEALEPLAPDRVTPELLPSGRLRFRYRDEAGRDSVLVQEEVFRVPGLSLDGVRPLSPIEYFRETFGLAAAQHDYIARFYKNDARPGGLIEMPADFKTTADLEKFRELWQKSFTEGNRHKTGILQAGMTYKEIGLKHTDAQFLEMMKLTRQDIAAMFRLPPHMLGDLSQATNNNIEFQGLAFVTQTLLPWLRRWEGAIKRDLIAEDDIFAEFLVDGLLRGDSNARQNFYREALTDGWMTPNEVRELENRNPLPGLDKPRQPLNMAPVDGAGSRDRLLGIARAGAERAVHREIKLLETWAKRTANDPERFTVKLAVMYRELAEYLVKGLCLTEAQARTYCDGQRETIVRDGLIVIESWGEPQVTRLFNLAQQPEGAAATRVEPALRSLRLVTERAPSGALITTAEEIVNNG
jgi:HK97 family phage portal protein